MANVRVDWNIAAQINDVQHVAMEALKDAAEMILDESNKIAPIDEGTLINSGSTDVDEGDMSVNVFYDTPYAVRQHEDTTLRHKNGRRAKFLEHALLQNESNVLEYVQQKIADSLR